MNGDRECPPAALRRRAAMDQRAGRAAWVAAALLGLLGLLAACGPGLGGTGTGASSDALTSFGAEAVSVCQSDFADLLPCAGAGASPAPQGTPRRFAEAEPASRTLLELDAQDALLQLRCQRLQFSGTWGQVAGQSPRYYGRLHDGMVDAPAMLFVARSATGLTVRLADAQAQPLTAELPLRPVSGATTPAPCP